MNYKGSLSLLVLHSLTQQARHGYQIAQQIKQDSAGVLDFKEGTLYPTLHSMEKEGLISSTTAEENGRLRRYYHITEHGREQLAAEMQEWKRFSGAVNLILQKGVSG